MATSTVISNARTGHRTARVAINGFQGTLALDWANGVTLTLAGSTTAISTGVIDASNDRIVYITPGPATGVYITVGLSPTATSGAGSLLFPALEVPSPIYVPAGLAISALGLGATNFQAIPALIASDPG